MKIKAIIWACGVIVTVTGLFLGLRGAARAIGIDRKYQLDHPVRLELKRVCYSRESGDAFSPDAFREELLK